MCTLANVSKTLSQTLRQSVTDDVSADTVQLWRWSGLNLKTCSFNFCFYCGRDSLSLICVLRLAIILRSQKCFCLRADLGMSCMGLAKYCDVFASRLGLAVFYSCPGDSGLAADSALAHWLLTEHSAKGTREGYGII